MNHGEQMVVLIVLIIMVSSVFRTIAKNGTRAVRPSPDPEAARLRQEVQQLKERLQVLERVITDTHQSASLDRQIDALRDR